MNRHDGNHGFTIFEMLLALSLMAVLLASAYASLSIVYGADRRLQEITKEQVSLGNAVSLIENDLASALPSTGILRGAFICENEELNGLDADKVTFYKMQTVINNHDGSLCGIQEISYQLIEDPDYNGQYQLVRQVTNNLLEANVTEEPESQVICTGVRSFNLRFYHEYDWIDEWNSSMGGGQLPKAVELKLAIYKPQFVQSVSMPNPKSMDGYGEEETYLSLKKIVLMPAFAVESEKQTSVTKMGGH